MLIKIRPGDWKTQLKRINQKVDEDNGKSSGIGNGRYQKYRRFYRNECWKNIGCIVSDSTFGMGTGSRPIYPLRSHSLVHRENNSYFVGIGPIRDVELSCKF